jgi:hypothetical protein
MMLERKLSSAPLCKKRPGSQPHHYQVLFCSSVRARNYYVHNNYEPAHHSYTHTEAIKGIISKASIGSTSALPSSQQPPHVVKIPKITKAVHMRLNKAKPAEVVDPGADSEDGWEELSDGDAEMGGGEEKPATIAPRTPQGPPKSSRPNTVPNKRRKVGSGPKVTVVQTALRPYGQQPSPPVSRSSLVRSPSNLIVEFGTALHFDV